MPLLRGRQFTVGRSRRTAARGDHYRRAAHVASGRRRRCRWAPIPVGAARRRRSRRNRWRGRRRALSKSDSRRCRSRRRARHLLSVRPAHRRRSRIRRPLVRRIADFDCLAADGRLRRRRSHPDLSSAALTGRRRRANCHRDFRSHAPGRVQRWHSPAGSDRTVWAGGLRGRSEPPRNRRAARARCDAGNRHTPGRPK